MAALSGNQIKAVLYILLNIVSGTGIVFANKIVLSVYKFHFVYALTLIHTTATMVSQHPSSRASWTSGFSLWLSCLGDTGMILKHLHLASRWACGLLRGLACTKERL